MALVGSFEACPKDIRKRDFLSSESGILWMAENALSLPFTDRERTRGILAIYINTFLMYGGFFMVIPLISLHYGDDLGWSTATVGAVLAVRQLVQQGLALIGGILADRFGAKPPIVTGLLVRAAGFAWMAFADTPATLLASAVLAALGGAFFEAPKSAAGATLSRPEQRARFYTTVGVVGNIGMACGPVLGAVLLRWSFSVVSLAAAAIFLIASCVDGFVLPRVPSRRAGRSTWPRACCWPSATGGSCGSRCW